MIRCRHLLSFALIGAEPECGLEFLLASIECMLWVARLSVSVRYFQTMLFYNLASTLHGVPRLGTFDWRFPVTDPDTLGVAETRQTRNHQKYESLCRKKC
jgi:hypothetical protein